MNKNMRGMVYLGPGQLELREVAVPEIGPDDILLKMRAATTCGTDVKTYKRGYALVPPPSLLGHELSGDVVAAGKNVKKFKEGDRVVPHNSAPCGKCYYCKHGQHSMCDTLYFNWGAYAEYMRIPGSIVEWNAFIIPPHLSYAQAAIMEPFSTVVQGQRIINIQPGETVAIFGCGGPIGLMHLQMALHHGATRIIAVDLKDQRLEVARSLGATDLVNPARQDPVQVVKELTDGRGADVTIEAAGAKETWLNAINSARKGGRVLWFGGLPGGTMIELDTTLVHYSQLSLHGVFHSTPLDVLNAFRMISSGVLNTKALISGELPLERVEDALKMMINGECIKMAINPELSPA